MKTALIVLGILVVIWFALGSNAPEPAPYGKMDVPSASPPTTPGLSYADAQTLGGIVGTAEACDPKDRDTVITATAMPKAIEAVFGKSPTLLEGFERGRQAGQKIGGRKDPTICAEARQALAKIRSAAH